VTSQRAWIERPSSFIETMTQQPLDRSGRSTSATAIPSPDALGGASSGRHPVSETATNKSANKRAPRSPIVNVASTPLVLDDLALNVASVSGARKGLRQKRDVIVESGHRSDNP
jgi:hypothetical protein